VLSLQKRVVDLLENRVREGVPAGLTAEQIASELGAPAEVELVFKICEHLAENPERGLVQAGRGSPAAATYRCA
jgi:hypothetical protein